jgi:hypothetical protein
LDVCEIGEAVGFTGQIKQVKALGVMALLDEGKSSSSLRNTWTVGRHTKLAPNNKAGGRMGKRQPGSATSVTTTFIITPGAVTGSGVCNGVWCDNPITIFP